MDSEVMHQVLEAHLASSTERVSGELSISQSSVIRHFHNHGKSIQSYQIVPHINKILQNFWLTYVFVLF